MNSFQDLPLQESLLRAVTELGFTAPTPIQAQTLPLLLGNDVDFLGLAATGTGKTAAFSLPLLERIDRSKKGVQAIVLCPTRELAIQVAQQIDLLGKYMGVKSLPIYGGVGYRDQFDGLERGANIVVGTPGRVVDHLEKGSLKLSNLRTLILDEADEMISMGFKEDLEKILESAPEGQANTWLFSATMGPEVRHVADRYLTNPEKVQVNRSEVLSANVEQIYYMIHEYDKPELIVKLIEAADDFYGIIFCQTKALVTDLLDFMIKKGYRATALHGDLNQDQRDRVMRSFRDHQCNVLIATDVACRGLDVKDISHVINYSLPRELDNYVHRIGRTARSGKSGIAISLVTRSHIGLVKRIEQVTRSRMVEGKVPSRREVASAKVNKALTSFQDQPFAERALSMMNAEWTAELENLSKEEIAARFLTIIYRDIFVDKDAPKAAASAPAKKAAPAPTASVAAPAAKPKVKKTKVEVPSPAPVVNAADAEAEAPAFAAYDPSIAAALSAKTAPAAETENDEQDELSVEAPLAAAPEALAPAPGTANSKPKRGFRTLAPLKTTDEAPAATESSDDEESETAAESAPSLISFDDSESESESEEASEPVEKKRPSRPAAKRFGRQEDSAPSAAPPRFKPRFGEGRSNSRPDFTGQSRSWADRNREKRDSRLPPWERQSSGFSSGSSSGPSFGPSSRSAGPRFERRDGDRPAPRFNREDRPARSFQRDDRAAPRFAREERSQGRDEWNSGGKPRFGAGNREGGSSREGGGSRWVNPKFGSGRSTPAPRDFKGSRSPMGDFSKKPSKWSKNREN